VSEWTEQRYQDALARNARIEAIEDIRRDPEQALAEIERLQTLLKNERSSPAWGALADALAHEERRVSR
jgi:transposase InsO family protein